MYKFSIKTINLLTSFSIGLALIATLSSCGKSTEKKPPTATPAMPAPEVMVITVKKTNILLQQEFNGRLESSRSAEIRARVPGIINKRLFTEGAQVKAGQPLFLIDDAPYQAALANAKASLATAQASYNHSVLQEKRLQPLAQAKAISQQDYDNAKTSLAQTQAQVQAAKAAVQSAQINLNYSKITAPISGKIGRALVSEGALVGQGMATQLATIEQTDPLYVNFNQSASEVMQLRKAISQGELKALAGTIPVGIILEDNSLYNEQGKLLFEDLSVNQSTGQISLRATVANKQGLLFPGMYVRISLPRAQVEHASLVPQQAVTRTTQGDTVIIVNADGSYAPRPVKIFTAQGNQWLINSGLEDGEMVMIEGSSKLMYRPKLLKPVPWKATTEAKDNQPTKTTSNGDAAKENIKTAPTTPDAKTAPVTK